MELPLVGPLGLWREASMAMQVGRRVRERHWAPREASFAACSVGANPTLSFVDMWSGVYEIAGTSPWAGGSFSFFEDIHLKIQDGIDIFHHTDQSKLFKY